jgi:hypothetical protein
MVVVGALLPFLGAGDFARAGWPERAPARTLRLRHASRYQGQRVCAIGKQIAIIVAATRRRKPRISPVATGSRTLLLGHGKAERHAIVVHQDFGLPAGSSAGFRGPTINGGVPSPSRARELENEQSRLWSWVWIGAVSRALAGKRWSEVRAGIDVADTLTQHFLRTQIALPTLRAGARTTARLPLRTR